MLEAIKKLESMLNWSDRLGSDERAEIGEVLVLLKKKSFNLSEMEKAFIAGGKLANNIKNESFEEFVENLKK